MSRAPLCQELHIVSYSHSVSTIFASVLTPVDRQCVHLVHSLSAFRLEVYSGCQNYRTEPGVQKYGKIPYLCTPPGSDSARSREI